MAIQREEVYPDSSPLSNSVPAQPLPSISDYGLPSEEEALAGFAALGRPFPIACYVAASDFAAPVYCCGGFEESVAIEYLDDYLRRDFEGTARQLAGQESRCEFFRVSVRHEKHREWTGLELCASLHLTVDVEESRRRLEELIELAGEAGLEVAFKPSKPAKREGPPGGRAL